MLIRLTPLNWDEQWNRCEIKYLKFYRDDTREMSWRTYPYRRACQKPSDATYDYRGWFIYEWLVEHGYDPETDPYIVVDDDTDYYPLDTKRFIHVDHGEHRGGFTFKHYIATRSVLIDLLGEPIDLKHKGDSK